jgi:hypothetical protein
MLVAAMFLSGVARPLVAQGGLHYAGGSYDIRDMLVPSPGSYLALYNYFYTSRQLDDRNGDQLTSFTVTTPSGQTVPVSVNVDVFMSAQSPLFMWVSPKQFLGGKYAAYFAPQFANTNLNVAATTASSLGGLVTAGAVGWGDPFLQPLWLGWTKPHWDLSIGEGVYAPFGKYSTRTVTAPSGSSLTVASPDNIGLGFWENQLQAAGAWYADTAHATALVGVLTWEIPGEKRALNYTPGQMLTLNWGFSQYLPVPRSANLLWEAGVAGYNSWQVTKASGSGFTGPNNSSRVDAVGGELNLTYPQWSLVLTIHGFYEYSAASRLRGPSFGINMGGKL